ncbi:MAG: hypothetical protein IPM39_12760 [Chloroflexi bacterium]|nr:hypothetical protein [Chloroflexota bacterium]
MASPRNPKRATARPTMERLLEAFDNINLSIIHLTGQRVCQATPLTAVQQRILSLLGLSATLYTNWTVAEPVNQGWIGPVDGI